MNKFQPATVSVRVIYTPGDRTTEASTVEPKTNLRGAEAGRPAVQADPNANAPPARR
ncbi:MAG TPA: hypothetical protein VGD96_06025 [Bradyrhizobium sp.]